MTLALRRLALSLAAACTVLPVQQPAGPQTPLRRDLMGALEPGALVGIAVRDLESGNGVTLNDDRRYPMQSVYKFPLALAVLHRVDRGELALDQVVHIDRKELLPGTWSPLRDAHPDADVDISLAELLRYVVSQSDNNGCDVLFRLMGGTAPVERYVHGLGVRDIAIAATEQEMHRDWQVQYRNWARPSALVDLLEQFQRRRIVSEKSQAFLWGLLVETTTGPNRLKGRLPSNVVVAHKTGSSGSNKQGVTAAVNDIGILVLPDGRHIALAVLVAETRAPDEASERIIANVARIVVDHALAGHVLK